MVIPIKATSNDTQQDDPAQIEWSEGTQTFGSVEIPWCLYEELLRQFDDMDVVVNQGENYYAALKRCVKDVIVAVLASIGRDCLAENNPQADPQLWSVDANHSKPDGDYWQPAGARLYAHPLFYYSGENRVVVARQGAGQTYESFSITNE